MICKSGKCLKGDQNNPNGFIHFIKGSWLKASQDISRMSSLNNQTANGYENQTEQNYPWYWHCNQSCNSAAPQSPHCYYHHHMCAPNASQASASNNDPVLMQQFIQTQQMLINSMSQCNQLLWDQQREINNLNSAVLLVSKEMRAQICCETGSRFHFIFFFQILFRRFKNVC